MPVAISNDEIQIVALSEAGNVWTWNFKTGWKPLDSSPDVPVETPADLRLRAAIASIVDAMQDGSKVSPNASIEFLAEDCRLAIIRHLRATNARATVAEQRVAALESELNDTKHGRVTESMLRANDGYIHVGKGCEIAIAGTSEKLAAAEARIAELEATTVNPGTTANP